MARACLPLDPSAVAAANAALRDRTRPPGRPLDPSSPADASLRVEWMGAYADAGGEVDELDDDRAADDPVAKCDPPAAPDARPADFVTFSLIDESTSDPLEQLMLKIEYPDGSVHEHVTDANGTVSIPGRTGSAFTVREVVSTRTEPHTEVSTVARGRRA